MSDYTTDTVGRIVAKDYRKASVFKKYDIDFCCGGGISVEEACRLKNANYDQVLQELGKIDQQNKSEDVDYNTWELDDLVDHIIDVHHKYVKEQTPIVAQFVNRVKLVHGANKPNVSDIADHFNALADELSMHMHKEEMVLFPYIKQLVEAKENGENIQSPFGTIQNPIRMMLAEHESAGNELETLRKLTESYHPPKGACATHTVSYGHLKDFEEDLIQHIHLENNILFPKAIALEEELSRL